jgi:hypothetical protein
MKTDMREVVRHLVDEDRRGGLALDAGLREISRPERMQLLGGEFLERARIGAASAARGARANHARQHGDVGQLHGAFDARVRRQDLLDERGAGARQAHHEYRIRRRIAEASALCEEFRREQALRTLDVRVVLVGVVANHLPSQVVALTIVLERLGVLARVFERLAERELEMKPVVGRQRGARRAARALLWVCAGENRNVLRFARLQ